MDKFEGKVWVRTDKGIVISDEPAMTVHSEFTGESEKEVYDLKQREALKQQYGDLDPKEAEEALTNWAHIDARGNRLPVVASRLAERNAKLYQKLMSKLDQQQIQRLERKLDQLKLPTEERTKKNLARNRKDYEGSTLSSEERKLLQKQVGLALKAKQVQQEKERRKVPPPQQYADGFRKQEIVRHLLSLSPAEIAEIQKKFEGTNNVDK